MPRREQEPEVIPEGAGWRQGAKTYRHPADGQVVVSKVSGQTTLYGSDFYHREWVEIRVYESEFTRDLSRDWPHAKREFISFKLSEAQWAAFVSSAGNGSGTQCTLNHVMGEVRPDIPYRNADAEHRPELDKRIQDGLAELAEARNQLMASGLSKAKMAPILASLNKAEQELTSNVAFVAKSYGEAMEARTEKAKVEINAYVTNAVMRAGLTALNGPGAEPPIALLDSKPSDPA